MLAEWKPIAGDAGCRLIGEARRASKGLLNFHHGDTEKVGHEGFNREGRKGREED
jgi:hypothetical protein